MSGNRFNYDTDEFKKFLIDSGIGMPRVSFSETNSSVLMLRQFLRLLPCALLSSLGGRTGNLSSASATWWYSKCSMAGCSLDWNVGLSKYTVDVISSEASFIIAEKLFGEKKERDYALVAKMRVKGDIATLPVPFLQNLLPYIGEDTKANEVWWCSVSLASGLELAWDLDYLYCTIGEVASWAHAHLEANPPPVVMVDEEKGEGVTLFACEGGENMEDECGFGRYEFVPSPDLLPRTALVYDKLLRNFNRISDKKKLMFERKSTLDYVISNSIRSGDLQDIYFFCLLARTWSTQIVREVWKFLTTTELDVSVVSCNFMSAYIRACIPSRYGHRIKDVDLQVEPIGGLVILLYTDKLLNPIFHTASMVICIARARYKGCGGDNDLDRLLLIVKRDIMEFTDTNYITAEGDYMAAITSAFDEQDNNMMYLVETSEMVNGLKELEAREYQSLVSEYPNLNSEYGPDPHPATYINGLSY